MTSINTFLNEVKNNPDTIIEVSVQYLSGKFGAGFSNQQPDKLIVEFYYDLHSEFLIILNNNSAKQAEMK